MGAYTQGPKIIYMYAQCMHNDMYYIITQGDYL